MKANPRRRRTLWIFVAVLLAASFSPFSLTAGADNDSTAEVVDVTLELNLSEIVDDGRAWGDANGRHIRERVATGSVEGDLSGDAHLPEDVYYKGPCDGVECRGRIDRIGQLVISTESERWSGTFSLTEDEVGITDARAILFERESGERRALFLDFATRSDDGTLQLQGRRITLTGPVAGVRFTQSMCITGPETAHGGFLANKPVADAGPGRIRFDALGSAGELGMRGDGRQVGRVGRFHTEYLSMRRADNLTGEFVLAGATGAYRELVGFGRMRASIVDEPRCDSGREVTAHWTGSVQITFDPARILPPQVRFTSPENRAGVENPVQVAADVWHVELEPAGEVREAHGHLHLIVDAPCVAPGETIPEDDEHIHLDDGSSSLEINLPGGNHRLCLQLGNGAHVATAATDVIDIFVQPSQEEGGAF